MTFEAREKRKTSKTYFRSVILANDKKTEHHIFEQSVIVPNLDDHEILKKIKESRKLGEKT